MNHKKSRQNKEFQIFHAKVFRRLAVMFLVAMLLVYFLRTTVLHRRVGDTIIDILQNVFLMEYDAAYSLYQQAFRNRMDMILIIALVAAFLLIFRIYLKWFTKYFEEILGKRAAQDLETGTPMHFSYVKGMEDRKDELGLD